MHWRQRRGQQGEEMAVAYLQGQGYRIEQQNYRCRQGEVDVIAWDGTTLVFVEVKTKGQLRFGSGLAMVNLAKQKKLAQVAMLYVQQHRLQNVDIRFDVVAIRLLTGAAPEVTHVPAAFSPPAYFLY
ncbi:MAG: YraN family protein [Candidatus Tectimicrobiota bacterium]